MNGIKILDNHMAGLHRGELTVIGARRTRRRGFLLESVVEDRSYYGRLRGAFPRLWERPSLCSGNAAPRRVELNKT